MTFDAYEVYCDWQRERRMSIPTREWWVKACARSAEPARAVTEADRFQAEIDRERREGWGYGDTI